MKGKTGLDYFNQEKQRFIDRKWIVIEDEEKQLVLKDMKENEFVYTFRYLEDETNHFLQLEPTLTSSCMTHFWYNGDDDDENEIFLDFDLEKYRIQFTASMYEFEEGEVYVDVDVFIDGEEKHVLEENIPLSIKQKIRSVYSHFKQAIEESSMYRLYFATQTISYYEESAIIDPGEDL